MGTKVSHGLRHRFPECYRIETFPASAPAPPPLCEPGGRLCWFAPSTESVTALLGGTVKGGSVLVAIMDGEPVMF